MRYTIMGFSQKKAIELRLTPKELVFLRWFIDFMTTLRMKYCIVDKITYFWVNNETVMKELPLLGIRHIPNLRRLLKGLVGKNVLIYFVRRGNQAYYAVNHETMSELLSYVPQPKTVLRRGGLSK